jgi:flagellar FliJ protein
MDAVLPLLIERAQAARDRLAVEARQTAQALQQSHATLQRLQQFRAEYLARSPATRGTAVSPQALVDWQRFLARLDDAIRMQEQECEHRSQMDDARRRQLGEGQRRLMAFETLDRRRAAVREAALVRRAQRDADEFAARAARAAARSTR